MAAAPAQPSCPITFNSTLVTRKRPPRRSRAAASQRLESRPWPAASATAARGATGRRGGRRRGSCACTGSAPAGRSCGGRWRTGGPPASRPAWTSPSPTRPSPPRASPRCAAPSTRPTTSGATSSARTGFPQVQELQRVLGQHRGADGETRAVRRTLRFFTGRPPVGRACWAPATRAGLEQGS